MSDKIKALAAHEPKGKLEPFEFESTTLKPESVDIKVTYCGLCHSDLSMLDNEWGTTVYPFVPGHEVVGEVVAIGEQVKGIEVGDTVGLGWTSGSCMACQQCLMGNHNLCPNAEGTIVNRYGGFAERVQCHWAWAIKLPAGLDMAKAGPLFCGGITVFSPIVEFDVKPTDKVAVIGIGGLGHMALQFLNKWGCEVTAFSSNPAKTDEIKAMGAHHVLNSKDADAMKAAAGKFDFVLSTVNVSLDWAAIIETLAPKGRLHFVGATLEPVQVGVFSLLMGQKQLSASPLGSPATVAKMLDFCARHGIAPITENFKMSDANAAVKHLREGKARYRIVLENDLA